MFKRILCPYDFTPHASRGLAYAVRLARRFRGHLEIVTVRTAPTGAPPGATARPLTRVERYTLEREIEMAGGTGPLPADARVVIGKPSSDINAIARNDQADLLVMGTHGDVDAATANAANASTTLQVLGRTVIPVLAVPPGAADPRVCPLGSGEMVLGIDFEEACAAEVMAAADVARVYEARLLLVHVIDPRPSSGDFREMHASRDVERVARARTALEHMLSMTPPGVESSGLLLIGSPAEELAAIARERRAGLVVTGLRNPGSLLRPPQGSIAYRVLCLASVPVLALPPAPAGDYSLFKRRHHEDRDSADRDLPASRL